MVQADSRFVEEQVVLSFIERWNDFLLKGFLTGAPPAAPPAIPGMNLDAMNSMFGNPAFQQVLFPRSKPLIYLFSL
jgi:hypothetical protein